MIHKQQKTRQEDKTLQGTVQKILREEKPKTVSELFSIALKYNANLSQEELAEAVRRLKEESKIFLEMPPPGVKSFREYIMLREWNTWFSFVVLICLLTVVAVYLVPSVYPYITLRWIAGSIFVLFLPGYVTVQALFPFSRDLDDVERFALSVGLSLAITPLIGLMLNYLPWGIRLEPIVFSLCLYSLATGLIGTWRRYHSATRAHQPGTSV